MIAAVMDWFIVEDGEAAGPFKESRSGVGWGRGYSETQATLKG